MHLRRIFETGLQIRELLPGLEEFLNVSLGEDEKKHHRQYPGQIETQESEELHTLARIGLGNEVVPAPAVAVAAEQHEQEGAERKNVVADDEVFKIKHGAALAEGLEAGPHVEAENAGQGKQGEHQEIDDLGLLPGPAVTVHEKGDDVFQNGDDRGERRGAHEHKEQ